MYYLCTIKYSFKDIMQTVTARKQTSFRLSEDLVARLRVEARKHNRSLNNFVESILMMFVADKPNDMTLGAMKEAERGENLETLDLAEFKSFVNSL